MSVMSSGFLASQATAALQVIGLPAVDLNSARSEEKSGDVAGTQYCRNNVGIMVPLWLDTAMALRIEGAFSNLTFVDGAALQVERAWVVLRAANKLRGEVDMGKSNLRYDNLAQIEVY